MAIFFYAEDILSLITAQCTLHTLPHTMPVAVAVHAMASSTSKLNQKSWPDDASLPDASSMSKKARKRNRNVGKEPQAQVEVPSAGTSKAVEDEPWIWHSLTDSSASKVPPFFTKDGKCVVSKYNKQSLPRLMLETQLFF